MMDSSALIISLGIGIGFVYLVDKAFSLSKNARHPPLPPGPRGLPLVGNLLDLPKGGEFESHHWLKHKDLYGPISSITVMGQTMVILNDSRLVFELLEKQSAKYSSRPNLAFAGEMVGWKDAFAMVPNNSRWRKYRKDSARVVGSKAAAAQFSPLQEAEVGHFLLHLLESPEHLFDHIRKETGTTILKIVYGYTAEPHQNDPLIDLVDGAMAHFAIAANPGAWMVDIFPLLKNIPDWVPGTGFKKVAREWAAELDELIEKPRAFVKHQMAQGKDNMSFLSRLLEAGDTDPEQHLTNKVGAMSMYAAGADTTVSSMMCFFLAMMVYPKVQRKAQEEIDRVVGQGRLPTMTDRSNLPYIGAVIKEVLRWHPVAPMALAHTSTEDNICEGYFIPKGAMLLPNVYHFTHDPNRYKDPMEFKPERFLATDGHEPETDPNQFVFGFGRRACAGRELAGNTLYLNIAQTLAVFNIGKHVENGREVEPAVEFESGVISHPLPYKCLIKPRSPHHEKLIRSIEDIYPWEKSDAKTLERVASTI